MFDLSDSFLCSYSPSPHSLKDPQRSERNLAKALAFEEGMFARRSRYLILILTLSYNDVYKPGTTLDTLRADRDRFFNNTRHNALLNPINGYLWKIEEGGKGGGLHLHMVLFYDRAFRADIPIAQEIGEYWSNNVTGGRGSYWNSNADKKKFACAYGNATGQIDRNNFEKRTALRRFLTYLAKDDQHVTDRSVPHVRLFDTSRLPPLVSDAEDDIDGI